MSKFFTSWLGPLLALSLPVLGSEEVNPATPTPSLPATTAKEADLPGPLVADRYAALGKKSPFTLASASQENADFAKDLVLAGYVLIDSKDFVMVANRSRPERILVGSSPSPSAQGMVLVKIERDPSGDATKMQARIRKGTEEATLKYEAASTAAPTTPVPAQPGAPGQPPSLGQPPAAPVPGQPGQKNAPVIRRRVVPIPTPTR